MLTMIVLKICFQCIYFALNEKKYFLFYKEKHICIIFQKLHYGL